MCEHHCRDEAADSFPSRRRLHRDRHGSRGEREPLVCSHPCRRRRKPTTDVSGRLVSHVEVARPNTPQHDHLSEIVLLARRLRRVTKHRLHRTKPFPAMLEGPTVPKRVAISGTATFSRCSRQTQPESIVSLRWSWRRVQPTGVLKSIRGDFTASGSRRSRE